MNDIVFYHSVCANISVKTLDRTLEACGPDAGSKKFESTNSVDLFCVTRCPAGPETCSVGDPNFVTDHVQNDSKVASQHRKIDRLCCEGVWVLYQICENEWGTKEQG